MTMSIYPPVAVLIVPCCSASWREVSNQGARDPVRAGTPISVGPADTWKMSPERQGQQGPPERQGADGLFEMLDSGGEGAMGASRYTSTSALRPFTRAAVTRSSVEGSARRSRVAPLTRMLLPSSLVRLWMREARLTASPTSV